ncbi:hypothetical protein DYH55_17220 [Methylovirgula sp. 4M-Z18]|nr:hypothetical protein DYH55_17220 [Methylovirgula sp. 4M-Z18]
MNGRTIVNEIETHRKHSAGGKLDIFYDPNEPEKIEPIRHSSSLILTVGIIGWVIYKHVN